MKLSVCIPTYNRAAFIGETIKSILSQANEDVELVISDNASTDDTEKVIEEAVGSFPHVKYFRWERNMGADRNFLKVIDIASGEYCWFMGSDDIAEPGAIASILESLAKYPDLTGLSVNRYAYKPDMSERIWERPVASGKLPHDRLFTDADENFSILGEYLGYLPGQIVNREKWNAVVAAGGLEAYFNAYVHIYVIARMLQRNPRWLYLSFRCAGWRSGNDSFLSEGMYKRLTIDVLGYKKIAGDVFGVGSHPYQALMRTVAAVHVFHAIKDAKMKGASADFFVKAFKLCFSTYWSYPIFWLKTAPLFLVPRFCLLGVRSAYRGTLKKKRLQQVRG